MQLYGVPLEEAESDRALHNRRLDLAHSAAMLLDKNNLVKYDRRTGNLQVAIGPAQLTCALATAQAAAGMLACLACARLVCLDVVACCMVYPA